jgi:hypothetical protein
MGQNAVTEIVDSLVGITQFSASSIETAHGDVLREFLAMMRRRTSIPLSSIL